MNLIKTLLIAGLLGVACGCRTVNVAESQHAEPPPQVDNRKIIRDPSLNHIAEIVDLRTTQVGEGLIKMQATLQNNSLTRKRFNYRVDWVDENGIVIQSSLSNWQQMSLAGHESGAITATAPSLKAVDFRLKLLEDKR